MTPLDAEAVKVCNDLLRACSDSAERLRTANGGVEQEALKTLFEEMAEQRDFMVTDLEGEVTSLDGEPVEGGNVIAAFERGALNLKATVTGHDPNTVLSDCIAGEVGLLANYRDALLDELPATTRQLLQEHFRTVESGLASLQVLERATA